MSYKQNNYSFWDNMPPTSVDRSVRRHTRKVQHLIKVLPSEFTFRELLQAAGYLNVNKLDRPMRATITRNIPSSYRTDKKRDGARVYFKQRDQHSKGRKKTQQGKRNGNTSIDFSGMFFLFKRNMASY